jgi:hypothetical protein
MRWPCFYAVPESTLSASEDNDRRERAHAAPQPFQPSLIARTDVATLAWSFHRSANSCSISDGVSPPNHPPTMSKSCRSRPAQCRAFFGVVARRRTRAQRVRDSYAKVDGPQLSADAILELLSQPYQLASTAV